MDTGRLKTFASQARTILMQGVAQRLTAFGFNKDGSVTEEPREFEGGATFMGSTVSTDFYNKWQSLRNAIAEKSVEEIVEEAAYTWFNRLMAIRIMAKNGLIAPVLSYESDGIHVPVIVSDARRGMMPKMDDDSARKLAELLDDDSKTNEQFAILIVAYCHSNAVINNCFGQISDYTELLLPSNILTEGGFVHMMNNTEFITEEDYKSPELIGWLYQFYISDKKDDVFASFKNGKKAEAKDIPAATQIFTPNWIVKYMVQNTVGRIYLDNNPYSDVKASMQYLVDPEEPTPSDAIFRFDDIHDLTCADLACGSGHILNECFDLLYQLYLEEGYSRRNAIEDIFKYNLTGVDLDTRAKQLTQFALLLKACQKDASFADAHCMPKVFDMPEVNQYTYKETAGHFDCAYGITSDHTIREELTDAFTLLEQAENLGSIMKFKISDVTRDYMLKCLESYKAEPKYDKAFSSLLHGYELILTLTHKYAALVMNPPYMKATNMNDSLKSYAEENYEEGSLDMYSTFMMMAMNTIIKKGRVSMIVQPTWLVNYSFGAMRNYMLDNFTISSLLHMGRGNFGNDWGSIAFTLSEGSSNSTSLFFKLYERTFYRIEPEHISDLFLAAKSDHAFRYEFSSYSSSNFDISNITIGQKICYPCKQERFREVKNSPYCYTFSDDIISIINKTNIALFFNPATGLQTGNNNKYIRNWFETSFQDLNINWFPLVNGGDFRKWYGNFNDLIYWHNEGADIKNCKSSVLRNQQYYKKAGISWNRIASRGITLRAFPTGCFFDQAGDSMFCDNLDSLHCCMAYLNTKVAKTFFDMLAPTINLTAGMIGKLPYKEIPTNSDSLTLSRQNIDISKQDWDAHETSWDFSRNELLSMDSETMMENINYEIEKHYKETGEHILIDPAAPQTNSLEWCYNTYCTKWERMFMQLHENEEELNRQFIDIYGLQDELTPDVPLDEITILQQGEISIENNERVWHPDVVMKQLISYAVGCLMGRYSIDAPGLILANQGDSQNEYNAKVPISRFEIDDDGIIPLMGSDTDFADNATNRFKQWLAVAFGEETLVQNLNFIEKSLGKSIDSYFVKDFWKDHKKMYQHRPIYWLFSSKKGAFQCLTYMHRMTPYTAELVRTKYLLPHIEWLTQKRDDMQANAASLSTHDRKQLDSIVKQIDECREYHDQLHVIADQQIAFDLDDGVVVNYAKFGNVLSKIK